MDRKRIREVIQEARSNQIIHLVLTRGEGTHITLTQRN